MVQIFERFIIEGFDAGSIGKFVNWASLFHKFDSMMVIFCGISFGPISFWYHEGDFVGSFGGPRQQPSMKS